MLNNVKCSLFLVKVCVRQNRPPGELIVKQGKICLTREDFWSLGLSQCMESNVRIFNLSLQHKKNKIPR